ncbi:MAG: hypothetical protein JWR05_431 [Mucilaginibacter sp.]|nr:hypothetical protein [Mucilaginibacter sp.]
MKLKKGIVIDNQLPGGYEEVQINSGTIGYVDRTLQKVNFEEFKYIPQFEDDAYVPRPDWRSLAPQELACLLSNENLNDHNTVYLGEIPQKLKDSFQDLALTGSKDRDDVYEKLSRQVKKTKELNLNLNILLSQLSDNKPFHFHCIGTNFPNLETVACNLYGLPHNYKPQDIKYMGMHNDSSVHTSIQTAHKFGNRIAINLGAESRSFLFVNLSMKQALNMLKRKIDVNQQGVNITNISRIFFEHFPDYPVIRIQQKPYQYYIAPTDNCFHDGSTIGNTNLDITMIFLGRFSN